MKRALLVIDVQNEYFTGKMPVSYPPGSLDNILKAMDSARAHHVPVVVVRHEAKGDRGVFKAGTEQWNLHKEVAARPADLLVDKNLPSSFAGTGLEQWLHANDRKRHRQGCRQGPAQRGPGYAGVDVQQGDGYG